MLTSVVVGRLYQDSQWILRLHFSDCDVFLKNYLQCLLITTKYLQNSKLSVLKKSKNLFFKHLNSHIYRRFSNRVRQRFATSGILTSSPSIPKFYKCLKWNGLRPNKFRLEVAIEVNCDFRFKKYYSWFSQTKLKHGTPPTWL